MRDSVTGEAPLRTSATVMAGDTSLDPSCGSWPVLILIVVGSSGATFASATPSRQSGVCGSLPSLSGASEQNASLFMNAVFSTNRTFENQTGGIELDGTGGMTKLWLENSSVVNNDDVFGIRASKAFLDITYSLVAANAKSSMVPQIACIQAPQGNLVARNSLIADPTEQFFAGCNPTLNEGNLKREEATLGALVESGVAASATSGGIAAKPGGPLEDQAIWRPGDTRHDQDMDFVRPTEEGPDYAGPDVP